MPTIFTHPIVALTLGRITGRPRSEVAAGAVLTVVPDLDFVAFHTVLGDWHWLGHRGATHSLAFAAVLAATALVLLPIARRPLGFEWIKGFLFLFACAASHGLLDALTNGGAGIAFFWPWSEARYFLPWQIIQVSAIGLDFFSRWGAAVLASEIVWIWFPCLVLLGAWHLGMMISGAGRRGATYRGDGHHDTR